MRPWVWVVAVAVLALSVTVVVLACIDPIALKGGAYAVSGAALRDVAVPTQAGRQGALFLVSEANATTDGFVVATEIKRTLSETGNTKRFAFVMAGNKFIEALLGFMRLSTGAPADHFRLLNVDFKQKRGTVRRIVDAVKEGYNVVLFLATCRKHKCGAFHAVRALPTDVPIFTVKIEDARGPRTWWLDASLTVTEQSHVELASMRDCATLNDFLWQELYGTTEATPCLRG